MFSLFKKTKKEDITLKTNNRLNDIRVGREYARGNSIGGNSYECFDNTAEEVYDSSLESSDDLQSVDKISFIQGYNQQREELLSVINGNLKD